MWRPEAAPLHTANIQYPCSKQMTSACCEHSDCTQHGTEQLHTRGHGGMRRERPEREAGSLKRFIVSTGIGGVGAEPARRKIPRTRLCPPSFLESHLLLFMRNYPSKCICQMAGNGSESDEDDQIHYGNRRLRISLERSTKFPLIPPGGKSLSNGGLIREGLRASRDPPWWPVGRRL